MCLNPHLLHRPWNPPVFHISPLKSSKSVILICLHVFRNSSYSNPLTSYLIPLWILHLLLKDLQVLTLSNNLPFSHWWTRVSRGKDTSQTLWCSHSRDKLISTSSFFSLQNVIMILPCSLYNIGYIGMSNCIPIHTVYSHWAILYTILHISTVWLLIYIYCKM